MDRKKSMADDVVYWSTYYNSQYPNSTYWTTLFTSFSAEHDPERVLKAAIEL